jgi:hypothetical protein
MTDANHTASARHSAHRVSAPARPPHHLGGADSSQPGMRTHRHQVPRLVGFAGAWPVPALRDQLSCTATKYSNAADQHRPTTPATGQ